MAISYVEIIAGSRYGLSLTLNIEQYEYTRGLKNYAGIKVGNANTIHPNTNTYRLHFDARVFEMDALWLRKPII